MNNLLNSLMNDKIIENMKFTKVRGNLFKTLEVSVFTCAFGTLENFYRTTII